MVGARYGSCPTATSSGARMRHNAHRRPADPALTFALGVALAAAISYPTVAGIGRGGVDMSAGAARIVAVLAITWCAVHGIAALVTALIRPARCSPPPPPGAARPRTSGVVTSDRAHADAA
jgi:hypothetical protein